MDSTENLPPYEEDHSNGCDEQCPRYSCTIFFAAPSLIKFELDRPYRRSSARGWQRVHVELQGTKLALRTEAQRYGFSLQAGDVGLALDYGKRSDVIRVRAEGRQFLLATRSQAQSLEWIDRIGAAVAISSQLDDRNEPRVRSRPWSNPFVAVPQTGDDFWRLYREKWRRSCREQVWLRGPTSTEKIECERGRASGIDPTTSDKDSRSNIKSKKQSTSSEKSMVTSFGAKSDEKAEKDVSSMSRSKSPPPAKSTSDAQLAYAKRCARCLLYSSPWTTKWYYHQGHRVEIKAPGASLTPNVPGS